MSEEQKEVANPIKWSLHDTHPELVENARARLSEVVDPEIGMNILENCKIFYFFIKYSLIF